MSATTAHISDLPIEIIQLIAFETGILNPKDVLAFALASKSTHAKLLGEVGSPNPFDQSQHRALAGPLYCVMKGCWDGALLAAKRGWDGGMDTGAARLACQIACSKGKESVVAAMMDRGWTPRGIFGALLCGESAGIIRLLLEDGRVDPAADNDEAIRWAAENGHTEAVCVLLGDDRVNPAARSNSAVCWASRNGHTDVIRLLLDDHRVDPAFEDDCPLRWAAEYGHTDVVRVLLKDDRVNPRARDDAALSAARRNRYYEIEQLLTDAIASSPGPASSTSNSNSN